MRNTYNNYTLKEKLEQVSLKYSLWKHQREAVEKFLKNNYKLYINFEVGLGKTRTALAIAELIEKPLFVLAPLSAIPSWHSEAEELNFPLDIQVYTYEKFRRIADTLNIPKDTLIVFDEAHRVKSHKAQTSKKAFVLFKDYPYKLMLSGTPIEKLHEIYMQFKILEPSLFQESYSKWLTRNFVLNAYWQPVFPKADPETLMKPIKPYLITKTQKEVLDLPPLSINRIKFEKVKLDETEAFNSLSAFITTYREAQATKEKFNWTLDFLKDNPKTIVFVYFKDTVEAYKKHLKNKAYYITGGNKKDLQKVLSKGDKPVIATFSLKEGANLQHYNNIVFHTLPLAYRDYQQSVGRIYRAGQKKHCNIYILLQQDIDYAVRTILKEKGDVLSFFKKQGKEG